MAYDIEQFSSRPHCLECGDVIQYGRTDKKFCSNTCKNHYHNRINYANKKLRIRVAGTLESNYAILKWMMSTGRSFVPVSELQMMGFDPSFFTSVSKTGRHRELSCYDIRYCMTDYKIFNVRRISL